MIQIRNDNENLTIIGHSNNGDHISTRDDIESCAAITALSQGLCFALSEAGYGNLGAILESGMFYLSKEGLGHDGTVLVDGFAKAMEAVADGYPEQVDYRSDI